MSAQGYVPSNAEMEAGTRYLDARRQQARMLLLMPFAALAVCWLPVGPLLFNEAWWTVTVAPVLVVGFAMWVFGAWGRARGGSAVAFACLKAMRRSDAPPLDVYLALIEHHRHSVG